MNENDNVALLDKTPVTEVDISVKTPGSKHSPVDSFKANEVLLNLGKEFNDQFNCIFGKGKPDDNSSE